MVLVAALLMPSAGLALEPEQVIVVANKSSGRSMNLARYYMEQRGIPEKNLVTIWVSGREEVCTRKQYEKRIAGPVRKHLEGYPTSRKLHCLVTTFGVPLKVDAPELTREQRKARDGLQKQLEDLQKKGAAKAETDAVKRRLRDYSAFWHRASVDSELSLVLAKDVPLKGWVQNPLFYGNKDRRDRLPVKPQQVLMVSRLDGPGPDVAKRIVEDSLTAEREGLRGTAYFDARWKFDEQARSGNGLYDGSLHRAARRVRDSKRLDVKLDQEQKLFGKGEAPNAALYCGWYSLGRYVDAFTWQKGAVGYHMASQECQTLKDEDSNVWCVKMLQKGAAAVVGPVDEPYLQAFPLPELFFGSLITGKTTLVESYYMSLPWLSWKMVLVGDPLYRPFGHDQNAK